MIMSFLYENRCSKVQFVIGILQFLVCSTLIGRLWATGWSIMHLILVPSSTPKTMPNQPYNEFDNSK